MRRRRQGQLATFAMLIPMFAVPVMAVFGIPQFAPVVASPAGQRQPEWLADHSFSEIGHSDAHSSRSLNLVAPKSKQLDLFQPYPDAEGQPFVGSRSLTAAERSSGREVANTRPVAAEPPAPSAEVLDLFVPVDGTRPQQRGLNAGATPPSRSSAANPGIKPAPKAAYATEQQPSAGQTLRIRIADQPDTLSWRGAVDRLNQLGIRTYRLSPSAGDGRFHFMCLVTSADDPRISRRFEAESHEPLDAVDRVLAQVEEWNQIR